MDPALVEPSSTRHQLVDSDLRAALDSMRQCVVIRDESLGIVYTNPAARSTLGIAEQGELEPEQLQSWTILDEAGEPANLPLRRVITEGSSWHGILFQVHREGRPIQWLESEARPFAFRDGSVGAISVFTDVTLKHELRLRAEENERYFRTIAANANDVMWRNDESNRIVWMSDSVGDVLGYRPADLIGTEFLELIHLDDQRSGRAATTGARSGDIEATVRVRRTDGQWRRLAIHAAPFVDADGVTRGTFATARDVTAEARAQAELRQSVEQLRIIAATNDALSGELKPPEIYRRAAVTLARAVGDSAIILLLDDTKTHMKPVAVDHVDVESREALESALGTNPIPLSGTLSEHVVGTKMSILAGPQMIVEKGSDLSRMVAEYLERAHVASVVIAPLIVDDDVVGVLVAGRPVGSDPFTELDRAFVDELSWRMAIAINSARLREGLVEAQRTYRLIAESASDVVFRLSLTARCEWVSPSVQSMFGWAPEELISLSANDLSHPDDRDSALRRFRRLKSGPVHHRFRFRCRDGTYKWVEATMRLARTADGAPLSVIAGLRDINSEVAAQKALKTSEETFRLAMAQAPIGMAIVALDGQFLQVNESLCEILDFPEAELVGKTFQDITHPDDLEEDLQLANKLVADEIPDFTLEKRYLRRDGRAVWVELRASVVRAEDGSPQFFMAQIADIDEVKKARASLEFRAQHDGLTGALNRRALLDELGQIAKRNDSGTVAVLYCDVDLFKDINDSYGHDVGDEVLRRIVGRLSDRVRGEDLVARVGGDEFVIAVASLSSPEQAREIAEAIRERVRVPMQVGTVELDLSMSVGVALLVPGEDPREVIRRADEALYQAKRQGRDRVAVAVPPAD